MSDETTNESSEAEAKPVDFHAHKSKDAADAAGVPEAPPAPPPAQPEPAPEPAPDVNKCENCPEPATTADSHGTPLCDACAQICIEDQEKADAEAAAEAEAAEIAAAEAKDGPPYHPGDKVFIHANGGKFIAVIEERYPDYATAEAAYKLSFQTITRKGPLYDYKAPHYLCHLANPGKAPAGACETDIKLKARCED